MHPKYLVIDANIIFSFFKQKSARRYLIDELLSRNCKLIVPNFVFEEILKRKDKVMKFSGIDSDEFDFLISILGDELILINEADYKKFLSEAHKISPHESECKDDPYFACALAGDSCIWSDEKAFKNQSKVKVYSTKDLMKLFRLD